MSLTMTLGEVAGLIQEVADAVEVLLDAAIFPDRLTSQDDDADPRHARYLLAMKNLTDAFGLEAERATRSHPGSEQGRVGGGRK